MTDEFNPSPRLGDRIEAAIKATRAFTRANAKNIKMQVAALGLKDRVRLESEVKLIDSIKGRVNAPQLELQRVAFGFARHGIFLERGVGKGRKVNSAEARAAARPWLSVTLPRIVKDLAELLTNEYAEVAVDEIKINVPGVISTKIKTNG